LTSAFCPEHEALMSATGEMLYVAAMAADAEAAQTSAMALTTVTTRRMARS
jgi:hypothetical protein